MLSLSACFSPIREKPIIEPQNIEIQEPEKQKLKEPEKQKEITTTKNPNYLIYSLVLLCIIAGSSYTYKNHEEKQIHEKLKGVTMADIDLHKVSNFVNELKEATSAESKWLSRKLWITISVVAGLVYLFFNNLAIILPYATALLITYMVIAYFESKDDKKYKFETKKLLIEQMAKDGITKEESEIINQIK